jgi:hypothetical protein
LNQYITIERLFNFLSQSEKRNQLNWQNKSRKLPTRDREDMQNALKGIFGPVFESMLKGEMNHHLGYDSNDKTEKQQKIDGVVMERKRLKQVRVRWTLRCQEIETVPLIRS